MNKLLLVEKNRLSFRHFLMQQSYPIYLWNLFDSYYLKNQGLSSWLFPVLQSKSLRGANTQVKSDRIRLTSWIVSLWSHKAAKNRIDFCSSSDRGARGFSKLSHSARFTQTSLSSGSIVEVFWSRVKILQTSTRVGEGAFVNAAAQ